MPVAKNFFIKTFGCQMNVYDSDKMKDIFLANNIQPTEDSFNADYVVLNTCHIREKATEKTFSDLGRIHKKGKKEQTLKTGFSILTPADFMKKHAISYRNG